MTVVTDTAGKQPRDQSARDTDTLFACSGTVFPASDEESYLTLYTASLFHHLLHRSHGLWISLPFPAMLHSLECQGEALALCSIPRQTETWGRREGILADFYLNMYRVLYNIFLGPAAQ